MTLEQTLQDLAERRLSFKAYRAQVEEDLRKLRLERLAAEQANIEHLIVKAMAEGATLGQVKRAYQTKDHRTITTIVNARAAEIDALRNAVVEEVAKTDWFDLVGDMVRITVGDHEAWFTWAEVDDKLLFITDEPLWDTDFTIRNEAVALLDGKTESDTAEAAEIARAIREGQN